MQLYGKRFLHKKMDDASKSRVESRDAVVIDIDHENKFCRVKIQGSEEYIVAHFPENTSNTPYYLKPGNSVRLLHKGGVRGKVEVAGNGQTIPTGINIKPPQENIAKDCILSGCEIILPQAYRDSYSPKGILWVNTGTYRAGGKVKQTKAVTCTKTNPLKMKNAPVIGSIAAQFILPMPKKDNWQYHRAVLNTDTGAIELLSGKESLTPVLPDLAQNKLDCGWILLSGNDTAINETAINTQWQRPEAMFFIVEGKEYLLAGESVTAIKISIKDQFGAPIANSGGKWTANVTITSGTGNLSAVGADDPIKARSVTVSSKVGGSELVFAYWRLLAGAEKSPLLTITVNEMKESAYEMNITLFNANGEIL